MKLIDDGVLAYAEKHSSPESELLNMINRDTNAEVMYPRMLSGHLQGRILSMISHLIAPKRILEIGTYTGYSALCLAEGLANGGSLTTIEINPELEGRIKGYFKANILGPSIDLKIGDAKTIIPKLDGLFDLAFIDADKTNYNNYYELVFDKLRQGGFIIADNVLWSGKVLGGKKVIDEDTRALIAFNEMIQKDNRIENVLLPVRDGLMIIRKL